MSYKENAFQPTPGKVNLFSKDPAQKKNPNGPDWDGDLLLTRSYAVGETIKLSIWQNTTKNGGTYFTIKENTYFKDKKEEHKEVPPSYKPHTTGFGSKRDDPDEDVPF